MANYTYDTLPDQLREVVPTDNELASALDATLTELHARNRIEDEGR
nr:hypothetical protein GCM10017611_14830 [Rhodococcus wratislaviensis]